VLFVGTTIALPASTCWRRRRRRTTNHLHPTREDMSAVKTDLASRSADLCPKRRLGRPTSAPVSRLFPSLKTSARLLHNRGRAVQVARMVHVTYWVPAYRAMDATAGTLRVGAVDATAGGPSSLLQNATGVSPFTTTYGLLNGCNIPSKVRHNNNGIMSLSMAICWIRSSGCDTSTSSCGMAMITISPWTWSPRA